MCWDLFLPEKNKSFCQYRDNPTSSHAFGHLHPPSLIPPTKKKKGYVFILLLSRMIFFLLISALTFLDTSCHWKTSPSPQEQHTFSI